MPPKRKDEAFADLEQNLQNIMAGVTKPKTTTTPSTPTTSASQTTFQGNYLVRFKQNWSNQSEHTVIWIYLTIFFCKFLLRFSKLVKLMQ